MTRLEVTLIQHDNQYYLISDRNDWKEGLVYDTIRKEVIYYNGDYGEQRPEGLKFIIGKPEEIGYVETGRRVVKMNGYPVDYEVHYQDITQEHIDTILNENGGKCFIEMENCRDCVFRQGGVSSPDCCHNHQIKYVTEKLIIHQTNEELHFTLS